MKDVIWLVISPRRVERMTKAPPDVRRGEIAAKVTVEVPAGAFRPPGGNETWREWDKQAEEVLRGFLPPEDLP